ncbi:DUF3373 domain-containing protein [Nautilia sp. PV-1]|uniref:DUF3373 family protein n=1 Tax=Nautilia sp. PV-1 TaxID=2579250 RepID=UPI000FD8ECF5|nr:DUF3373 family protein [Nautilia sp. PV-1]AZV47194.1 DUF3373 domain-containing protein [Nautilia sp. PV-1]
MKKLLLSATVVAGLFAAPTVDSLQKQINDLQKQLKELKAEQTAQNTRYYKKVAPVVTNSHLYWSYDLRTTFDFIKKETTGGFVMDGAVNTGQFGPTFTDKSPFIMYNGHMVSGQKYYGRVFSNRIILTGVVKPSDNLKATVRVEANKVFGFSNINGFQEPYQNVDWVTNETPDDANIRIKEAFFNYWFGPDNALMFSAGRRPATEGFPANLREGDPANSPLAHLINMEFDGFSFEIGNPIFSKISDKFADWGTWLKFCAGRGYSNTNGKWSFTSNPDYTADDNLKDSDFAGFILVPYDDGQYSIKTETVWAFNLRGFRPSGEYNATTGVYGYAMPTVGNYFGENIVLAANGIGNDNFSSDAVNDFLDGTTAFISYAYSQTRPKSGQKMLGSADKKSGHSWWIGADMPGFGDNDHFGISYVKGSKYWRSFTYGEDTLAGSIAAVRGHAIDTYYNTQIIPHLTAGIRYTYIKYDYPGSDAFFGDMGDPSTVNAYGYPVNYVKSAKDIRVFVRYKF